MTPERSNWYAQIAVAVLVIALVILSVSLVRQYRVAARQSAVAAARLHFADLVRRHSLGAGDVGLIEPWMTFDYVSVSFKVPVPYLKVALDIASSAAGYPNVTLGRYARTIATSSAAFTMTVRAAVQDYLIPSSPVASAVPPPLAASGTPSGQ